MKLMIVKVISKDKVGFLTYEWVGNKYLFSHDNAKIFSEKDDVDGKIEDAFRSCYNYDFRINETIIEKIYL
jgi:hypothetical protein